MDPTVIAALEAALEAEDPKKAISALLEKIKAMAPDTEPASERGEGQAQRAAEPEPKDQPRAEGMEPEAAKARAARPLSAADAGRIAERSARAVLAEHEERRSLIDANREALGSKLAAHLATQPLSTVKSMVAARLSDKADADTASGGTHRAARVTLGPITGGSPADRETQDAVSAVNRLMGIDRQDKPAFEIDGMGTMRISHVAAQPFDVTMVAKMAGAGKGA